MHLVFHDQWMFRCRYERPRANTDITKLVIKSVVCTKKMHFYCFLYQNVNFWCIWIVMIVTHHALELQLVFLMLFQNMVSYYVYVWSLVFVVLKFNIIDVSTDWTCNIFALLNAVCGDFLLFFLCFAIAPARQITSTQHSYWKYFGCKNHFHHL